MKHFTRRTSIIRALFPILIILASTSMLASGVTSTAQAAEGNKLVLAFYYMWYGPADFGKGQMLDTPATAYNSSDTGTIERQVLEARNAGIDAFITSWSGLNTPSDANFAKLLDIAAKDNFKATIYFETPTVMRQGDVTAELQGMLAKYANNPAFLHWNGKPVVFFWSPQSLGGTTLWQAVRQAVDPNSNQMWSVDTTDISYLSVFDTIHFYSAGKWQANTDVSQVDAQWRAKVDAYNKQHGTQRLWTAGVIPGWDESRIQPPRPNAKVFPRSDGALYKAEWQGAIASNPEWITITSYNEWYEGTQIEPAASYGTQYLDLTASYVNQYKGAQSSAPAHVASLGAGSCAGGTLVPETGYTICAEMMSYWQANGGVQQFGYPISNAANEKSALDGKAYMTQYFERAIIELHPENPAPYNVMLAQIGTLEYRKLYPNGAPGQKPNQEAGKLFAETGKWVGGAFLQRWQNNGGLAVNGYPISDEFQEQLAEGKTYTVQYFERARFEFHPENPAPYNVLLGALGRLMLGQK